MGWIKSLKQSNGSFVVVIAREVTGTDGSTAIIEDFRTFASPLEFAQGVLTAHGVEPAFVFGAMARPTPPLHAESLAVAAGEPATGGGASSQVPVREDSTPQAPLEPNLDPFGIMPEEPPLRACATGGCGDE